MNNVKTGVENVIEKYYSFCEDQWVTHLNLWGRIPTVWKHLVLLIKSCTFSSVENVQRVYIEGAHISTNPFLSNAPLILTSAAHLQRYRTVSYTHVILSDIQTAICGSFCHSQCFQVPILLLWKTIPPTCRWQAQHATAKNTVSLLLPLRATCHVYAVINIHSSRMVHFLVVLTLHCLSDIPLRLHPMSFPYFSRWCGVTAPCLPSCLHLAPYSLNLPPAAVFFPPPTFTCLYLPSLIFPLIFILMPPSKPLSPSIPLSLSLCPLSSLSLSLSALMNCLPLPVNSTDNPGEAVKDHRSAPQTGPQATAQEQHANNNPLHSLLSVGI